MLHITDRGAKSHYGQDRETHIIVWKDTIEQVRAVCKAGKAGYLSAVNPEYGSTGWLGRNDLKNWDDVQRAIEEPWNSGLEMVDDMIAQMEKIELPAPRSLRRSPVWNENSGDFSYDQYSEGNPFWRGAAKRDMTGQQFVTICAQIGGNGGVRPKELMWRGAVAITLCKILEEQGYSVEIISYDYGLGTIQGKGEGGYRGKNLLCATWVKFAEKPLDKQSLINTMSAWYFRLVNFGSYYLVPDHVPTPGFGSESIAPKRCIEQITKDPNSYWNITNVFDVESATKMAKEFLEGLAQKEGVCR